MPHHDDAGPRRLPGRLLGRLPAPGVGSLTGRDPRWPRTFRHRLTAPLLGPRGVLELMRATRATASGPGGRDASGVPVAPGAPDAPLPVAGAGEIAVTWLGHASALVDLDGVRVLVDPVLGGIPGNRVRLTPPGATVAALGHVDALLITHDHYDHLDEPTVRALPRTTRVLVGAGGGPWFARRGFVDVTELDWWERTRVDGVSGGGGVDVEFVPAHHWTRRGPFDTCRRLWGGWVLTGRDGRAVVHAGDTGYGTFPARIGAHLAATGRDVALALLPVGAYAPRHLLRRVHMDPDDAVRAAGDLGARRMLPIHWGAFVLTAEPVAEPLALTREAWAGAGRDPADLWTVAVGETRTL